MKPNVGAKEGVARIVVGTAALASALFLVRRNPRLAAVLGFVGASGLETGLSRYCPINDAFGIDNAPRLMETPIHRTSPRGVRRARWSHDQDESGRVRAPR